MTSNPATDSTTDDDDVLPLSAEWWETNRQLCALTPLQARFAQAVIENPGASQARLAKIAGYTGDGAYLRSQGSRLAGNQKIQALVSLAQNAKKEVDATIALPDEILKHLSELARTKQGDPRIRIAAQKELLNFHKGQADFRKVKLGDVLGTMVRCGMQSPGNPFLVAAAFVHAKSEAYSGSTDAKEWEPPPEAVQYLQNLHPQIWSLIDAL